MTVDGAASTSERVARPRDVAAVEGMGRLVIGGCWPAALDILRPQQISGGVA